MLFTIIFDYTQLLPDRMESADSEKLRYDWFPVIQMTLPLWLRPNAIRLKLSWRAAVSSLSLKRDTSSALLYSLVQAFRLQLIVQQRDSEPTSRDIHRSHLL